LARGVRSRSTPTATTLKPPGTAVRNALRTRSSSNPRRIRTSRFSTRRATRGQLGNAHMYQINLWRAEAGRCIFVAIEARALHRPPAICSRRMTGLLLDAQSLCVELASRSTRHVAIARRVAAARAWRTRPRNRLGRYVVTLALRFCYVRKRHKSADVTLLRFARGAPFSFAIRLRQGFGGRKWRRGARVLSTCLRTELAGGN